MTITAIRFPLPMEQLGFPAVAGLGGVTVWSGPPAWAWSVPPPQLSIEPCMPPDPAPVAGWRIDHAVVMCPNLDDTVDSLTDAGADLRRRAQVRGRAAAFLLAGVLLEVIEAPVAAPELWGLALETGDDLAGVAARWRAAGLAAGEPRNAIQPGRSIFSVDGVRLAVMSPRG